MCEHASAGGRWEGEGAEGTSFPRERPTALHAWTNLYASESDH